jgi:hypothetical protein
MARQPMTKALSDADVTPEPPVVQIPAPDLQIVERGLRNVFGLPSAEVKLKDPRFVTHWCNTGIGGDQLGKYLDAGYLKVRVEFLADPDRVAFAASPEGYVVRGARGEEILMYTLHEVYRKRQQEKARRNQVGMRNAKAEAVEAAGQTLGDEAADFLNRHGSVVGGVRDSFERIERRDEQE